MDPVTQILALFNLSLAIGQQAQKLWELHNSGGATQADITAAQAETKRLMAESDALRSTPRTDG